MSALTNDRLTNQQGPAGLTGGGPSFVSLPVADNVLIYAGALVVQDTSGYARPGRASTSDVAIGRARRHTDNTVAGHTAGGIRVDVELGVFGFDNDAGAPVLASTQMGTSVYVLDDHTVTLTSSGHNKAGKLSQLDPSGSGQVFVMMNPMLATAV